MTVERQRGDHPVQRQFSKGSNVKRFCGGFVLPLASLLFLLVHSVIAVRGFSTVPTTARGRTEISTIAVLPSHRSGSVPARIHKENHMRESRSTALLAGLFGEKTRIKNQNNTYISSTSVSEPSIRSWWNSQIFQYSFGI